MNFHKIKEDIFFEDGSLRDINVEFLMLEKDWYKLLIFLEDFNILYKINGKEYSFLDTVEKTCAYFKGIKTKNDKIESISIYIYVGNIQVNGFFMLGKGNILDIDPTEINTEEDFQALMSFLTQLSQHLDKKLYISSENSLEEMLLKV